MPLYEYRCEKCGSKFEVLQKYSDPPLTTHEDCGGAVEKLISVAGLHFKGSGFYITDYSRGSAPASAGNSTKSESSKGESTESKSTETKSPETKSSDSGTKADASPAPAASSTPAAPAKSD